MAQHQNNDWIILKKSSTNHEVTGEVIKENYAVPLPFSSQLTLQNKRGDWIQKIGRIPTVINMMVGF